MLLIIRLLGLTLFILLRSVPSYESRPPEAVSIPKDFKTTVTLENSHHDARLVKSLKKDQEFWINETTKLIYVDESTEAGFLIGEVGNSQSSVASGGNIPTNYSIFLVSRHKAHIAILLDVEDIHFEPIINCEYQELRLSIVGEIKNGLMDRVEASLDETLLNDFGISANASSSKYNNEESNKSTADSIISTETVSSSPKTANQTPSYPSTHTTVEDHEPVVPVTEAMALLLNSFMNKTILEEPEELNNFKTIDFCIDYLREEVCRELHDERRNQLSLTSTLAGQKSSAANETHRTINDKKQTRRRRVKSRKKAKSMRGGENRCPIASAQFRESMSDKLNNDFEWDEFRIVCGKTRQLLIPMRSLKLSVFSDEFSPKSRFKLRYRFLSDPSQLQSKDNNKYYCRNRNVINLDLKCDGYDDCGDASDESIKVCGYPSSRLVRPTSAASQTSLSSENSSSNNNVNSAKKIVHFSGELLNCCQTNDWMSLASPSQQLNLQTLIGDSMSLFSGLLLAPANGNSGRDAKNRRRVKRIVGGGVAQRGAWPGQVSLQYEILEPLSHFCAGTLIHPLYVLTAGHCITKDALSRGIKVVLGAHDLRQQSGDHIQVRYVDDAQIYPGVDVKHLPYDWDNDMNNDIALIRLNAPAIISPNVAPACLPPFNTPLGINTTCRSIGWGQTHGSGSSNLLKHLSLKVVNSTICSRELIDRDDDGDKVRSSKRRETRSSTKRVKTRADVSDYESSGVDHYSELTMLCMNNDQGHGICQGDSGGPLYCDRVTPGGDHCTEIYGVASFIIQYATVGAMCAVENLPGIFGEVSSKTEWIASTIRMFEQTYRLKHSLESSY